MKYSRLTELKIAAVASHPIRQHGGHESKGQPSHPGSFFSFTYIEIIG